MDLTGGYCKGRTKMKILLMVVTLLYISTAHGTYYPRIPIYVGRTTATSNGNFSGPAGGNTKCQVNFPNSHMCTQGEMLSSGTTTFVATAWVACDLASDNSISVMCAGRTGYNLGSADQTCVNFTSSSVAVSGPTVSATGVFGTATCDTSRVLHCCI